MSFRVILLNCFVTICFGLLSSQVLAVTCATMSTANANNCVAMGSNQKVCDSGCGVKRPKLFQNSDHAVTCSVICDCLNDPKHNEIASFPYNAPGCTNPK